ncbi:DUF4402 domain-containing protein [Spiribacter onubensis]|uniref:DUF4402 domain-containing protein n=1 Tax=Spiribacter onubensis TaxID=3122420 RepID=A0ABV3S893_9GAMM
MFQIIRLLPTVTLILFASVALPLSPVAIGQSDGASGSVGASAQIVRGIEITGVDDLQFGAILNGLESGTETISLEPDGSFQSAPDGLSSVNDTVTGTSQVQAATFSVESEDAQTKTGQEIRIELTSDLGGGADAPSITGLDVAYDNAGNVGDDNSTAVTINSATIPASAAENLQVGGTLEVSANTPAGTYDGGTITVTSTFK